MLFLHYALLLKSRITVASGSTLLYNIERVTYWARLNMHGFNHCNKLKRTVRIYIVCLPIFLYHLKLYNAYYYSLWEIFLILTSTVPTSLFDDCAILDGHTADQQTAISIFCKILLLCKQIKPFSALLVEFGLFYGFCWTSSRIKSDKSKEE